MSNTLRVTVWGENVHDHNNATVKAIYPQGMHSCIAAFLNQAGGITARTAVLQDHEHGLTDEVLDNTDVLTWWGHCAHGQVSDAVVDRIQRRVLAGMGLIVLHSGHHSKIFRRLMGHNCDLTWREAGEKERLWVVNPAHPICAGLPATSFEIEHEEMYGEPFGIPNPDELVFVSWFQGGEVFRSGATWRRGAGKVFYFRPGHETYPTYHQPLVQQVIINGVRWARPDGTFAWGCPNIKPEQAREKVTVWGGSVH
jgi:trehalose utilization protein